ncbi:5'/3'-nucleotidase sure family protein [Schizophyllum amplum]|uniref:5'/3'-nucleotidase sure family protein n=1 Tax=Schizophyllum amplum TaxID=97359 RepID=A0A550CGN3_9AGAR|nr:5'/3'-nucleotidase sure family protein [Auriculariopsis ampla]
MFSVQLWAALLVLQTTLSGTVASPLPRAAGIPILVGNDDGWAEANIRAFYTQAKAAGYNTLVSAPAYDKSGSGSSSTTPEPLTTPGEYDSIPSGSPAVGHDASDDHLWYVNAYPADGITYGLANLSATYLGGPPALVVTGPNQGSNLGIATLFSGTVGAAAAAGMPAIAFSGASGSHRAYTELVAGDYSYVYADAALRLVDALLAGGVPYLPSGTALNVNFPEAGPGTACESGADVVFVMSRVYWALGLPIDAAQCGGNTLPTESSVVGTEGCYASVSLFDTSNKLDAGKADQQTVVDALGDFLSCLP